MPEKMLFASMIQDYGVPFTAYQKPAADAKGHYERGEWINPSSIPVAAFGVIVPFSNDELRYTEAGTYSTKDRKLSTLEPLELGQEIAYKGILYTVEQYKDLEEFTDVFMYVARWAGNADRRT